MKISNILIRYSIIHLYINIDNLKICWISVVVVLISKMRVNSVPLLMKEWQEALFLHSKRNFTQKLLNPVAPEMLKHAVLSSTASNPIITTPSMDLELRYASMVWSVARQREIPKSSSSLVRQFEYFSANWKVQRGCCPNIIWSNTKRNPNFGQISEVCVLLEGFSAKLTPTTKLSLYGTKKWEVITYHK